MKKTLFLLCLLLMTLYCSAIAIANELSKDGGISECDAIIKESKYSAEIQQDGGRYAVNEEEVQILSETGRKAHADKSVFIDKTCSEINLLKGGTRLKNGAFEPLETAGINEITPSSLANSLTYGNFVSKIFSFSSADIGNTLYLKYEIKRKNEEGYDSDILLVQGNDKIINAEISIYHPNGVPFSYETNIASIENGNALNAQVKNLPAIKPETNKPPYEETGKFLAYSTAKDWKHAVNFFKNATDNQADYQSEIIATKAEELCWGHSEDKDKIRSCLYFVNQKIANVYLPLGIGSYKPRKASEILKSGYGDSKDKTTLLIALLKAEGISALPVLIRTDFASIIKNVPTIRQFDLTLPAVKRGDGKWGVLNVMSQNAQTGYVNTRKGAQALLLDSSPSFIKYIPYFDISDKCYGVVTAKMESDGSCTADIKLSAKGIFDIPARTIINENKGKQLDMFMDRAADSFSAGAFVQNFETSAGEDYLNPVSIKLSLYAKNFALTQDRYMIANVSPPPFAFSWIPYNVSAAERTYPYMLGSCKTSEYKFILSLPPEVKPLFMPSPIKAEGSFGRIETGCEYDSKSHKISFRRRMEIKNDRISPKEYYIFKQIIENISKQENKLILLERT